MYTLWVFALLAGIVSADISLTYKVPETTYGVPSYQYNNNADYNTGNSYTGSSGYNYNAQSADASSQAGFQGGNFGPANNVVGNQYFQSSGAFQPTNQFSGASSQGADQYYNQYQSQSEYQSSAVQKYQEFYNQWQQKPAQVFKHFYVHAAPEEPEPPKPRQQIVLPPPQKHYKIIFVKAPTQTVYTPQYIPVPQPNDEKTIVYVLVKKPEEQQEVVLPKIEQKPPTKPEVFFIKYNNKADSQAVINNIVNDYNKDGSASFVNGIASGSGQYSEAAGAGQSNAASGQYSQGSFGQYSQGNQNTGFGAQTVGNTASGQAAGASDASSSAFTSGYSSAGASSTASAINYPNTIPTHQVIPHETYGPPKFRQ